MILNKFRRTRNEYRVNRGEQRDTFHKVHAIVLKPIDSEVQEFLLGQFPIAVEVGFFQSLNDARFRRELGGAARALVEHFVESTQRKDELAHVDAAIVILIGLFEGLAR